MIRRRIGQNADVRARQAGREGDWPRIEQEALRAGDPVTWLEAKLQQARSTKGGLWPVSSIVTQVGWAALLGDQVAQEAFPLVKRRKPQFPAYGLSAWLAQPRSGGEQIRVSPLSVSAINKRGWASGGPQGWYLISDGATTTIERATEAGAPWHTDEEAWASAYAGAVEGDPEALSALLWVKSDSTDVGEGNPYWYDTHSTGEAIEPRLQPTAYGWILYESGRSQGLFRKWSMSFSIGRERSAAGDEFTFPQIAEAALVQSWFWNKVLGVPAPYTIREAAEFRVRSSPWNPPNLPFLPGTTYRAGSREDPFEGDQ